jgi:penicillin-binding protein A
MVLVAATIANNGNVITPYLVDAIRPPGGDWQPFPPPDISRAVTTGEVAAQIREAMRFPDPNTGDFGHASIAYTGAAGNVWFIGFAEKPDGGMIAVAVVIEGTTEVDAAVQIGTLALH